jgi:hypothetical protein
MARIDVRHHSATAEGLAGGAVAFLLLFGVVLVAPGAVLVFAIDRVAGLTLDCAQLWTFAVLGSAGLVGGLSAGAGSFTTGARRFAVLAFAVVVCLIVARFGFHARWPDRLWDAFAGRAGQVVQTVGP